MTYNFDRNSSVSLLKDPFKMLKDLFTLKEKYKSNFATVKTKNAVKESEKIISLFDVKTPNTSTLATALSGGNQQKISVAKWLASGTDILFIDEPTVGIDIKTKSYLHELIIDLSLKGTSIILITSDMPEMISLADRIITMKDFKVVGETINNHNYEEMSSSIMGNIHE